MADNLDYSFQPIARADAKILILGTMPGQASLQQQQYYAHPRNAFWQIMQHVFGISHELPYAQRCELLMQQGIAVWDVLMACRRKGSLDQNIETETMVANQIGNFLNRHAEIQQILFNGSKAEQLFNRFVLPDLSAHQARVGRLKMPSTSPAHAAVSMQAKIDLWQKALSVEVI